MSLSTYLIASIQDDFTNAIKSELPISDDDAKKIAENVAQRIKTAWGGQQIYIPAINTKQRNIKIMAEFTGSNHSFICRKFSISLRTLYRILE